MRSSFTPPRARFEACWREDATTRVRSGEVDLAVIVEGPQVSGLHVAPYRHDQLAAVMRNDDARDADVHAAESGRAVSVGALVGHLEGFAN